MSGPKPFLKWAGGKRRLLPHLLGHVTGVRPFENYHEPFVGAGALFFSLGSAWRPGTVINDSNRNLIRTYIAVRDHCDQVIELLMSYPHTARFFYLLRMQNPDELDDIHLAAWMIYLNKTAYNGLYRVNKKGQFNAPFGKYDKPKICDAANLHECSAVLKTVTILCADFSEALSYVRPSDFVYLDPPYHPLSKTSNFTSFTPGGFTADDQTRLRDEVASLKSRGAKVLLSNSAAPLIYELYRDFNVQEVRSTRPINSKASARGAVKELLIW